MNQIKRCRADKQPRSALHAGRGSGAIGKRRRRCLMVVLAGLCAAPQLCASTPEAQGTTPSLSADAPVDPDWQTSWNTAVRYNLGQRMQSRNPLIANNALYDQGDALFDRHDLVTNRIDLLSEFELVYRRRQGLRVTAAA